MMIHTMIQVILQFEFIGLIVLLMDYTIDGAGYGDWIIENAKWIGHYTVFVAIEFLADVLCKAGSKHCHLIVIPDFRIK